jgi:addiction module HigA family antidote
MIAHLNLRRNLASLYIAIGAHAFAFYVLYNTLVLWLISLGLPKATATSSFGAFVFAAYVTPMLGGWISTHTGLRPVAIVGAATAATGYLLTSLSPLAGIILVGIGCGFVKTAVTAMVGRLFPEGAPGADKAFAWFYSAINVGSFFSPIAASYLMSRYGFTTAFASAAVGDLVVLTTIAVNYRSLDVVESASSIAAVTGVAVELPSDSEAESRLDNAAGAATMRRRKMVALWIFLVLATLAFWPAYHQNGSGLTVWASEHTERMTRWGEIQPPMFALVNSLVCVFCGGMIVAAARWLSGAARRRQPSTPGEIFEKEFMSAYGWDYSKAARQIGVSWERLVDIMKGQAITHQEAVNLGRACGTSAEYWLNLQANADRGATRTASEPANAPQTTPLSFSTIAGYLTMAASFSCLLVAPIAKAHPAWLIVAIILSSISEILISSLGLAQVAKLTPRHLQPIYTSVWFVTSGVGGQIAGQLGGFALLTGFRILVALCLTGAVVASILRRRLDV